MTGYDESSLLSSLLYRSKLGDGGVESEALSVSDATLIDPQRAADVTLISLSSGDRTAHAFGTQSPKYSQAFHAIDGIIGQALARAGSDSDLLVFGDHGHDEMGRHLPGLAATTEYCWASLRRPSYLGSALEQIFAPKRAGVDRPRRGLVLGRGRARCIADGRRLERGALSTVLISADIV